MIFLCARLDATPALLAPFRGAKVHLPLTRSKISIADSLSWSKIALRVFSGLSLTLPPSEWEFHSEPDPTHGLVNYQPREDAINKKLAYVQEDGTTVLAVDDFTDVPVGGKRDS
jgi:hypothetical protein